MPGPNLHDEKATQKQDCPIKQRARPITRRCPENGYAPGLAALQTVFLYLVEQRGFRGTQCRAGLGHIAAMAA